MAGKKKKSAAEAKVTASKIRAIWTAVSPDSWLDFFRHFRSTNNFFFKGRELWGSCPYHNDHSASFHIRFDQGYAKCFGECSKFESDPIALAAHASGKPYAEAFTYLLNTYGLPGLAASALDDVKELAYQGEIKRIILSICNNELKDAASIGRCDPAYAYAQKTVAWLDARKIPLDLLHTLPLGVVPTPERLWQHLQEIEKKTKQRHHTAIQNYLEQIIPLSPTTAGPYAGWLLFANHTSPGNVGLFRIREPGTKEIRVVQEPNNDEPELGFFGLGTGLYQTVIGGEQEVAKRAVVVEGEFTALAAIVPQLQSGDLQTVVVSAGGNNNHCLDALENLGFKEVLLVGDRDDGGVSFVKSHLKETSMRARVFNWPSTIAHGSDLHDAYTAVGGAAVLKEIANYDKNFIFPQNWALNRLEAERVVYEKDDVGGLSKLAIRIGRILNDPSEQEAYVNAAAELLQIPDTQLKKYVASPDSESGFVAMLSQQLEKTYRFLYQEAHANGVKVYAWHRSLRKISVFDLSRMHTTVGTLKADLGSIVDWVSNHIGEPDWLKSVTDKSGNTTEKRLYIRQREYESYLTEQVIPNLAAGLPLKSNLTGLGQGIHWKEDSVNGYQLFAVNGDTFCKGASDEQGRITWTDIDGPMDGTFYVERNDCKFRWSKAFTCAEDINSYKPVDIVPLWQRAKSIFETGWRFDNQPLETAYLASFIFTVAMADAFDALPWIFVNSEYQTGKSYLVMYALSGSKKSTRIQLIEGAYGTDHFSDAGMRQRMRDATLMLVLDEFEVGHENGKGGRNNAAARAILGTLKGANAGGTQVTIGSVNGTSIEYKLRFPLICAGINPLIDRADVSRFNHMNLTSAERGGISGSTPEFAITRKFTQEQITELRFATTMYALQNFTRVKEEYMRIKEECANGAFFHPDTESRFKESFIPVLTVMKLAGIDYKSFAMAYTKLKVDKLADTYTMREYDELWNAMLHTTGVRVPSEEYKDRSFTIAQLLADPAKRHLINETATGVYFVDRKNYLLVRWTTASTSILRSTNFAGRNPVALKGVAALDKRTLPAEAWRVDPSVMRFLRNFSFHYKDITVIPISHFVKENIEGDGLEDAFQVKPPANGLVPIRVDAARPPAKAERDNI